MTAKYITPRNARRHASGVVACVMATLALPACRDNPRASVFSPTPEVRPMTATLAIERVADSDSTFAVTVRLDSAATISRVGSVTATIDFDSTRVRFVSDASPADHALRAAHVDRGRLRMAAASASGLAADALIRLTFVTHDTTALTAMRLDVSELHLLDATDLKRTLNVRPASAISSTVSRAVAR